MPRTTYPIILAHGIARFDILSHELFKFARLEAYDGLHYFRNIRTHLERHGFHVHHTDVEWADRVTACLPPERMEIHIEVRGDSSREFRIVATSERLAPVIKNLAARLGDG